MNFVELLEMAKKASGAESDSAFGRVLGAKRQTVSNWRNGNNFPDAVTCEKLAEISGIPLHRVLGIVGEARAISAAEKKVWRKLAAAIFVGIVIALPASAKAEIPTNGQASEAAAVCIMRNVRRIIRWLASSIAYLIRGKSDDQAAMLA